MKTIRIAGALALAAMLMGAACPPLQDIDNDCYPQLPDPLTGLCPEPGRDAPESTASEPAEAPEPAAAPSAPSPEPNEPETRDYDQKET